MEEETLRKKKKGRKWNEWGERGEKLVAPCCSSNPLDLAGREKSPGGEAGKPGPQTEAGKEAWSETAAGASCFQQRKLTSAVEIGNEGRVRKKRKKNR